ncbi:MAG TPA: 4Fe-4S binding protein [Clostridiales bacterium]|nr:4Fe-4S binding protein [Clostridiales bacterium]
MSCEWCHNPEGRKRVPFFHTLNRKKCTVCGSCASACIYSALTKA